MKNYFLTLLFTIACLNNSVFSNTNKGDIIGIWLNANGKGQVQIYKEGDKYFGKLYWLKEPNGPKGNPKVDINNPDPALKNKP